MSWDESTVALVTRVTARVSAIVFVGYLATHAGRRLLDGAIGPRLGTVARRVFTAFVLAHTVHFTAVAALTVVTRGANIGVRGDWIPVTAIGVLFYIGVLAIWRAERAMTRQIRVARSLWWLRVAGVTFIWVAFAQAYVLRLKESPLFLALGVALVLSFAGWIASLRGEQP